MTDKEYYSVIDRYSNSVGSFINPAEGGSPTKLQSYLSLDKDTKKSKAFQLGSLLHLCILEDERLHFSINDKPTNKAGELADEVIRLLTVPVNEHQQLGVINVPKGKGFVAYTHDDLGLTPNELGAVIKARENISYDSRLKEDTFINSHYMAKCKDYVDEMIKNQGKIGVTKSQKEIIDEAIKSLKRDSRANNYFFHENEEYIYLNEKVILFDYLIEGEEEGVISIPCKAKLDKIIINPKYKNVLIPDLKTTSTPVHAFGGYFDRGRIRYGSFQNFRYYRQGFLYKEAIKHYLIQQEMATEATIDEWNIEFELVVVEVKEFKEDRINDTNYNVGVFKLTPAWERLGMLESIDCMKRWQYFIETGDLEPIGDKKDGYYQVVNPI